MKKSPPILSVMTNLTSSRLLENSVSLSAREIGRDISSTDAGQTSPDMLSQSVSSQSAEGRCLRVATGASSLETIVVEESRIMPSSQARKVSEASAPHSYLAFFSTAMVGIIALALSATSIVAIVFGSNPSVRVPMGPDSQILEFETNRSEEESQ